MRALRRAFPGRPIRLWRFAAAAQRVARLRGLPPPVGLFYLRARRLAARSGDSWTLESVVKPESLAALLRLARGRRRVIEVGTGTAMTAAALALADPERRVVSFDPIVRPERERYLDLAGEDARARIDLIAAGGEAGPQATGAFGAPDMVFIDGSHERELTKATFRVWSDALADGGLVAFHDYRNPQYPGVTQAIEDLGLEGEAVRDIFVWRKA